MNSISDNVNRVRGAIAAACARVGRAASSVTLVAVSKTQPVAAILLAVEAGVQHFGENRVEEASIKIPGFSPPVPVTWHMVGHIQSRKAKTVPELFQVVHSIDSVKLAEKLSALMTERGGTLDALLEVNVSGEASKSGFAAVGWSADSFVRDPLWQDIERVLALPSLHVRGLMTMAPVVTDPEEVRPVFERLAALRDILAAEFGVALPDLSMGMTDDFPVAIEEGATMVRIGRAIFGERRK